MHWQIFQSVKPGVLISVLGSTYLDLGLSPRQARDTSVSENISLPVKALVNLIQPSLRNLLHPPTFASAFGCTACAVFNTMRCTRCSAQRNVGSVHLDGPGSAR
jgi:hypothetical protein